MARVSGHLRWLPFLGAMLFLIAACASDDSAGTSDADAVSADVQDTNLADNDSSDASDAAEDDGNTSPETDAADTADTADTDSDTAFVDPDPVTNLDPPPMPPTSLGFTPAARPIDGEVPSAEEVTAFTKKVMAFFKETHFYDWTYRTTHGLDASYDPDMMPYRMWWQGTGMRRDGDVVTFVHDSGYAENIAKRSVKLLDGAASGYLLTEDERMAELAADLMRGMVAMSLGLEFEREDPIVKYLQARAIFTHNHEYEVDGRKVAIDYSPIDTPKSKWNVHLFEIPDNPTYGKIWVANMRSKDDVPYMYHTVHLATRVYHQTDNEDLKAAAKLYIEYMRGFSQSIVDNDWFILTKYADGVATIAVDTDKPNSPPADLGSFVHWQSIMGPDAECNAQLGAALAGYGYTAGKEHCERGLIGHKFDLLSGAGNWFNYNIYNYFHIAAISTAHLWHQQGLAQAMIEGLIERFDNQLFDSGLPNTEHKEYNSDSAGWLISAATQGYPLSAREAQHVMKLYGESADWYREWPHWDPWTSLAEGEYVSNYKPIRDKQVDDGEGGTEPYAHIRSVEMGYVFEYCASPLRASTGIEILDCDIVADPGQW